MTTKPSNACQMPEEIWALKANDDDHFKDTDFDKRWDESCNGTNPWLSGGVKYIRADLVEKMKEVAMTKIYNFGVSTSYRFYIDDKGEQRFTRETTGCTVGRITLRNRIQMIIDFVDHVWSHK